MLRAIRKPIRHKHKMTDQTAATRDMANAIRALAMDAVQKANSGHPGMPMGMADVATVLFTKFMKFDAAEPNWPDRDRFILSAGHGSMLLYSLLLSHRLRGHDPRPAEEVPPARRPQDAGHPNTGIAERHRDDHRSARPGPREFGGLRPRRAP
jgi:transketolase